MKFFKFCALRILWLVIGFGKKSGRRQMKKSFGATLVSLAVLVLVGVGLYFWAYYPAQQRESQSEQSESELRLAQGDSDTDVSVAIGEENKKAEETISGNGSQKMGALPSEDGNRRKNPEDETGQSSEEKVSKGSAQEEDKKTGNLSMEDENRQGNSFQAEGSGGTENPAEEEANHQTQQPQGATLVYTGDIYLSQHIQNNYDNYGILGVVSENLLAEMKGGDIAMANQEFPFSTGGVKAPDKQFNFRVEPSYTKILTEMGIDVVGLANNHALDYGAEALIDTFEALDDAKIAYVGAGNDKARAMQPCIIEAGQQRFGFLAASRVIPEIGWNVENKQPGMLCTYDSRLLCQAIQEAKKDCDFLTVYVHWGIEKSNIPEAYQTQLAHQYIDAGADLVIGSHPHVLQGIEYYNGKPIVYSLGNYIFNQEIIATALLKVQVVPGKAPVLQLLASYASGAKTQEMNSEQAAELYRQIESISYAVAIGEDGIVQPLTYSGS